MFAHVFLSHSTADKPAIEDLAHRLAQEGIQAWLDKWHLIPGDPWQAAIEKALTESETCAVFVGPSGFGPWQNEEMRAAIDRRVQDRDKRFRVIPVLLPGAKRPDRDSLPTFLTALTWVEFRDSLHDHDAFHRLVCGIRGLKPGPGLSQVPYEGQCPYRGLRVFDVDDAPFFFGREALVQKLLHKARSASEGQPINRFLAIVGASGSGKSSVARAGLLAALKRDAIPGSSSWPTAILRPGYDPIESLAVALSKAAVVDQGAPALAEVIAEFQKNEKTLHLISRQSLSENAPDMRLVVVVDQFEEAFTLCREDERREALLRNLLYAAKVAQGQTLVILTMRADFYGKCAADAELAAAFSDHHVLVGPMTEEELRWAIERPTQSVGYELENGLVDLLVQDVRRQAGALPLLQHALLELWNKREGRRLTVKVYQEIGKLEGALQRRADATMEAFSKDEQEICRRTFLRLTQPGEGTEDTKRRASMQELLSLSGNSPTIEAVIQKLTDKTLLTTNRELTGKDAFVEVAHEALIRHWPQLRQWIDVDRTGLRIRTRLSESARDWENAGRNPAYLFTGVRLTEAKEWEDLHRNELSAGESEFLAHSLEVQMRRKTTELEATRRLAEEQNRRAELSEAREKEQREAARKLRRIAIVAAVTALLASILLVTSIIMWRAAQVQTKIATVRRLAAESAASLLVNHTVESLLLAVEAVKNGESLHGLQPEVSEQQLREVLGLIGGRPVVQSEAGMTNALISSDNHWLISVSDDDTARLWDLSVKEPSINSLVLRGHKGPILSLAISQDNHWLATGSADTTVRVWDLTAKDPSANPMVLRGYKGSVRAVAISRDNHWLVTGSDGSTAYLWDLTAKDPSANPKTLRGHEGAIRTVVISQDNHWLVTGSDDNTARLWNLTTKDPSNNPVALRGHKGSIRVVSISPDNHWLVTGSDDNKVLLWDLTAQDPSAKPLVLLGHKGPVYAATISADHHWLATGSYDSTARLWDLTAKDPSANPIVLYGHDRPLLAVAISPDNHWLVTASYDSTARLWDLTAKDPSANPLVFHGHDGPVLAVAISPDNRWLVTASSDKTARLWELNVQAQSASPLVLRGHDGPVRVMAISTDHHWLMTGSDDNTARLWNLTVQDPSTNAVVLRGHTGPVLAVAIGPNNHWLVTGSDDNTARLWDLTTKGLSSDPLVLRGHTGPVLAVAISPDNRWLVTGSGDNTARLWDLTSKNLSSDPLVLRGHTGPVVRVAISPDSHWLVTGSGDSTAQLWNLAAQDPSAKPLVLLGHNGPVLAVAISRDNRWLVTGSDDNTAQLWNLAAQDPSANPLVLQGHQDSVYAVAISANDRWLATGSGDSTARLWNLTDQRGGFEFLGYHFDQERFPPLVLRDHTGPVLAAAFSPDNSRLVTGSDDSTARLWNLTAKDASAKPVVLHGHKGPVLGVAVTPDNRWIVTSSADNSTRLWLLHENDLIKLARTVAGRNLTTAEWKHYFPGRLYQKTFPDLPSAERVAPETDNIVHARKGNLLDRAKWHFWYFE